MTEFRLAVRSLLANKGFSLVVIATLSVGIGATTAMFSAVYGVLVRPLPYADPERLVRLSEGYEGATPLRPGALLSNVTFHAWKAAGFQGLAGLEGYAPASDPAPAQIEGQRELLRMASVTPGLLTMLGVKPVRGRGFVPDDERQERIAVVVLSERYWRTRFGADDNVIGRTIVVLGAPRTIVGVMPGTFTLPDSATDVWRLMSIPEPTGPAPNPSFSAFFAVARLGPSATLEEVATAGSTIARRRDPKPLAARLTFGDGGPAFVRARPMAEEMTARVRSALMVVAAGIACILLIACVNAANLLLSRGAARTRELALRAALGASRMHLVRNLLTESLLLAATAAVIGLLFALWAVRVAGRLAPADFPRLDDIRLDLPAFGVAAGAALFTAVASAAPAIWQLRRISSAAAFTRGHGHGAGPLVGGRKARGALIAAEAAFAAVVLVAALLLARSFVELLRVDPGYSATGVLVVDIHRPGADLASATRFAPIMADALERIRALPGIEAAAFGVPTPLDLDTSLAAYPSPKARRSAEEILAGVAAAVPTALSRFYTVTADFERALGLRLRAGRFFDRSDQRSGDVVRWVVNDEFARLYLPPNAVGQRFPWARGGKPAQLEIIGIVGNVLKNGNDEAPAAEVYGIRRDTDPFFNPTLVVRSTLEQAKQGAAIRGVLREVAPEAVVTIAPLADRVSASLAMPRLASALFAGMAVLATLLTALGILAALSYGLAQRAHELGVRVAVGATRRQLVALVARDGAIPATAGVVLGLLAAVMVTRGMRATLFGVSPIDALSFALAPAVLIPVALLACLLPALRASRVDPVTALRSE